MAAYMQELTGIPESAEPLALAVRLEKQGAVIFVAVNDRAMEAVASALPFFAPEAEVLCFPAWDCLPYDRVSPRAEIASQRVAVLSRLALRQYRTPLVLITTAAAIMQRVPAPDYFRSGTLLLSAGNDISRKTLTSFFEAQGYRNTGKAIEAGEYALRGSIVDVIPPGREQGVRLDFFGDTLESMKHFDPLTQLSTGLCKELSLMPAGEIALSETNVERFREQYRERFGAVTKSDPLYEAISARQHFPGAEHWLPLFHEKLAALQDYLPDATLMLSAQTPDAMHERDETIRDYYAARQSAENTKGAMPYHPLPPELLYLPPVTGEGVIHFSPLGAGWKPAPRLHTLRAPEQDPFQQLADFAASMQKPVVLACASSGSLARIQTLLLERNIHNVVITSPIEAKKGIALAVLPLANGFETETICIISEEDILGERVIRAHRKRKAAEVFLAEAANFQPGELVVHREHGIGRFEGLVTLEVQGAKHDCLKLVYEGDDRLFLPVENIEIISRYGMETEGVKLDKLGAASWQARKAKLKQRITIAAEQLLKTAALRALKEGTALQAALQDEENFAARFGFVETEDQARAIEEVQNDLRSGKPMDRLVCGDVGFGKTEVALRAAFTAVKGHPKMQVAVVTPTTLLARQHTLNFKKRFDGLGVCVAQLSRLSTAAEVRDAKAGLKDGSVDIVIGTHALLGKGIEFKNLGLVIVDEEQHFGVAQKEKLKELCADVHVLTLSATPIPRTLQMALTGLRELSLITTPPVDRLAVRSFVMPWDPVVLREAILREKHRGGRTFVVTPRIADIGDLKVKLNELVPEIKLAVAHGQLAAHALDEIMNQFYDGEFDVLLSTSIIESGLDIPQANTLIVNRADRFGLAQLYQMRGRVGRGKIRAYSYFLTPPAGKHLSRDATRRLEVIQSLDTLGAGFQLASHDMDIRGAGNLLGEEQSGHVREVGVELYQQMLEETLAALKNTNPAARVVEWSPQINLGLAVLIPDHYVEDLTLRMSLYRRAGDLQTREELDAFAAELVDRFGPLPQEVQHLLTVMEMKQLCKAAGIARLDVGPKGAVISFHQDTFAKPDALLAYVMKHPTRLKLRPDQKLVLMQEWKQGQEKAAAVKPLLSAIAVL